MDKIEMAKAYSSGFDPQYREVAYDAFLCGYDAKCDVSSSEESVCLDDGGAPSKQKCGDCTIACEAKVEEEPDKSLEEAAKEYAEGIVQREDALMCKQAFVAGSEWQAEQDDRDVVFWKGMQHAYARMKEEAVEGVIIDSGFDDGTAFVTMNIPDRRYDRGDKVKLIIIKDDEKSD